MPAAEAKLGPGMTVAAVDGKTFSPDALRDAVSAAKTSKKPIQLFVNNEGTLVNYPINYHGGERYPHLVHDSTKPDLLSQTIAPLTPRR
jgi:predicted metalloprotease with PDZ domain